LWTAVTQNKEVTARFETCLSEALLVEVREKLTGTLEADELKRVRLLTSAEGMNGTWSTKVVRESARCLGGMSQASRGLKLWLRHFAQLGEPLGAVFGAVNRQGCGSFQWKAVLGDELPVERCFALGGTKVVVRVPGCADVPLCPFVSPVARFCDDRLLRVRCDSSALAEIQAAARDGVDKVGDTWQRFDVPDDFLEEWYSVMGRVERVVEGMRPVRLGDVLRLVDRRFTTGWAVNWSAATRMLAADVCCRLGQEARAFLFCSVEPYLNGDEGRAREVGEAIKVAIRQLTREG
jgi:hypothetical protein